MITCGNCKAKHANIASVKDCFANGSPVSPQAFAAAKAAVASAPPATEKQVSYLQALLGQRNYETLNGSLYERAFDMASGSGKAITKTEASALIEALKAAPALAKAAPAAQEATPELEDGIYLTGGTLYKVVHAVHGSGQQYAKTLTLIENWNLELHGKAKGSWEYAGRKPLHSIKPEDRLTADKAKEFGLLYGMCVNCARTLTLEQSIHVGYGKTCAGNNGWWYPTKAELKALAMPDATQPAQPDNGCRGGTCTTIDQQCSRHSAEYQAAFGRAANE